MIKRSKIIIAIFSVSILISCKTLRRGNIEGTYKYQSQESSGILTLQDSIFKLKYVASLVDYESSGNWVYTKGSIILNSTNEYKNDFIIVEEKVESDSKRYILLPNSKNEPEVGFVIINDKLVLQTDLNGMVNLDTIEDKIINSIMVESSLLTAEHNTYKVKNSKTNVFIITIYPKDYNKIYFAHDTLRLVKNKIFIGKQIYRKVQ